jgi:hypothetical protein
MRPRRTAERNDSMDLEPGLVRPLPVGAIGPRHGAARAPDNETHIWVPGCANPRKKVRRRFQTARKGSRGPPPDQAEGRPPAH